MTNDELARKHINIPEVIIKQHFLSYHDKQELLSVGFAALAEAIARHDKTRQDTFNAYAYRIVFGRILNFILKENSHRADKVLTKLTKKDRLKISIEFDYPNDDPLIAKILKAKNYIPIDTTKRAVIDLWVQGFNGGEIAKKLEKSRTTVYNHISLFIKQISLT